ncbi:MAG TPA: alpha/beta fold hydrolase [Pirellulales bacterium]|jgi:pimeloyl-ACP methyl ester carboxylesterase|nr:alpha/beta fold hydrolase [Pirellulales bacterium]
MQRLWEDDGGGAMINGLRVVTVGDDAGRRQLLLFMGLSACVEQYELRRLTLLAAAWNAQLTVVDVPGYGYGGARLTSTERRGLRRGDFSAVARRMVHTAQQHHPTLRQDPVTVVGYSMGASLACAAAADPGLLRITAMVLVEPVAMRRWSLPRLIRSVHSENATINDYLEKNRDFSDAMLPPERRNAELPQRSRGDLTHLGFAISRGHLISDLLRANLIQQFPVEIVHGMDSQLSQAADIARMRTICRRAGINILDVSVAGRHALWHSLPDVAALARATLQR